MPDIDGVPIIVMVLEAHEALTPVGNPVAAPIPVAPVVAIVIFGESNVLIHNVGEEDGLAAVLFGDTVTCL